MGKRYLQDLLETMGAYADSLKFAGGSFALMPMTALAELLDLCHEHNVLVSTGGFLEHVLTEGAEAVARYIQECRDVGFDVIEISCGFITIPADDWLRLIEKVQEAGLKAKPEVGIQFGAGGATKAEELEAEGTRDPRWCIQLAQRFLSPGAYNHDRIRRDYRERKDLAYGRSGTHRRRLGARKSHVRSGRSGCVLLVHPELRTGS